MCMLHFTPTSVVLSCYWKQGIVVACIANARKCANEDDIAEVFLSCDVARGANSLQFARTKCNRNRDKYIIEREKLIRISQCYENRGENRSSDSRRTCSPGHYRSFVEVGYSM